MSIYKACDIRGEFGTELMLEHADKLGLAVAHIIGAGNIIVGGDGRLSTPQLKRTLIKSLASQGCQVVDIGILPTPAFYFARGQLAIMPGIMVTASHNPAPDNGFKIILDELPIREENLRKIQELMENPPSPLGNLPGEIKTVEIISNYIESFQSFTPNLEGLNIVVDCANGMASLVAREIWQETQARVNLIYDHVDGNFPNHPPNPANAKNLGQLAEKVVALNADFGIAYDGDADRVAFVDENGSPLSLDKTIAILAREVLKTSGPAPVVFDQKCSRLVAEIISANGGKPIREKSGHTFIKTAFINHGATYAGELSGHHFFRTIAGDDGVYASLMMGNIIKNAGLSLSELANQIPSYPITPDLRIAFSQEEMDRVLADLLAGFSGRGTVTSIDGFRVDLDESWGMARKSVTEPVLTLRFEGKDQEALYKIIGSFVKAAPDLKGKLSYEIE